MSTHEPYTETVRAHYDGAVVSVTAGGKRLHVDLGKGGPLRQNPSIDISIEQAQALYDALAVALGRMEPDGPGQFA